MLIFKILDFVEIKQYPLNLNGKDTIYFNSAKKFSPNCVKIENCCVLTNLFYHFSYNYFHIFR